MKKLILILFMLLSACDEPVQNAVKNSFTLMDQGLFLDFAMSLEGEAHEEYDSSQKMLELRAYLRQFKKLKVAESTVVPSSGGGKQYVIVITGKKAEQREKILKLGVICRASSGEISQPDDCYEEHGIPVCYRNNGTLPGGNVCAVNSIKRIH